VAGGILALAASDALRSLDQRDLTVDEENKVVSRAIRDSHTELEDLEVCNSRPPGACILADPRRCAPPPLPPVLIGHVSFLTPYQLDPPPASVPLKGCAASLSQGWIEREYRGPGGAAAADGVDAYVHACDRLGATPLPQARSSLEAHIQRT